MVRVRVRERESALTFKSAPDVRVVRSESRAEFSVFNLLSLYSSRSDWRSLRTLVALCELELTATVHVLSEIPCTLAIAALAEISIKFEGLEQHRRGNRAQNKL